MTMPANIRVATSVPFPALVKGGGPVAVSKANGVWTVSLNFKSLLPGVAAVPNPASTYVLSWDSLTNTFYLIQFANAVQTSKVIKTLVNPGPYAALPTDDVLIVKQAVGAPFTINVDWSARVKPLQVVDGKGDAQANNISIVPVAGQTQLARLNYVYKIAGNGGSVILSPLPDGSGAY